MPRGSPGFASPDNRGRLGQRKRACGATIHAYQVLLANLLLQPDENIHRTAATDQSGLSSIERASSCSERAAVPKVIHRMRPKSRRIRHAGCTCSRTRQQRVAHHHRFWLIADGAWRWQVIALYEARFFHWLSWRTNLIKPVS